MPKNKGVIWVSICFILLAGPAFAGYIDSLVAYWDFNSDEDEILVDQSGNGHDGVITGEPELVEGKFLQAFQFDGIDDHVVVEDAEDLDLIEAATVLAWVTTDAVDGYRVILSKGDTTGNNSWNYALDIRDGAARFWICSGIDNTSAQAASLDGAVKPGGEYFIAASFDGKKIKIYVNDKSQEASQTAPPKHSGTVMNIGDYSKNAGYHWQGAIDEIMIFNTALTEEEFRAIQQNPSLALAVEAPGKLITTWARLKMR